MKKHHLFVMASALLLCVHPGTASAASPAEGAPAGGYNKAGTFSVSPMVGGVTFGGGQHLESAPVFALRGGYNFTKHLGVEALFDYAKSRSTRSSDTQDFFRYGADLLLHLWPDDKFVPYLAGGFAALDLKGSNAGDSSTEVAYDLGAGFKYFVTEDMAWRADARGIFYDSEFAVEYTTGVYIPFGGAPDVVKLADPPAPPQPVVRPLVADLPAQAAPAPAVVEPPPVVIAAPEVALSAAPASIVKGERATLSWKSQHADNCEMRPALGVVPVNGTLTVTPDIDTLYSLTCKGKGGTASSSAAVVVAVPKAMVPQPATPQERFCNKPSLIVINFDTDKFDIKPKYYGELKTVGEFLKEFPEAYGEISGHTDSIHTRQYNQKLSERRASSVKEYIIKTFAVDPKRLTSRGYGEDKPIASNNTADGRAKNRRIETNLICEDYGVTAPRPAAPPPPAAAFPREGSLPASPSAAVPGKPGAGGQGAVEPVPFAQRKTEPSASYLPRGPAPGQGGGAAEPSPLPSAQRKQDSSPGYPVAGALAEEGGAAQETPSVPLAQRRQEALAGYLPGGTAAEQGSAAPEPPSVPLAQRMPQPLPLSSTPPPVAPGVTPPPSSAPPAAALAAATDVPPLSSALRKQEPEPVAPDEEPFVLNAQGRPAGTPGKIALTGITIDKNGFSIFTDGRVSDFRMITQVEPYSLVIDIPGAVNGMGMLQAPVDKFDLLDVRFREFPDYLQITVNAGREQIIPYRSAKTDTGLRINIKPRSSHYIGP